MHWLIVTQYHTRQDLLALVRRPPPPATASVACQTMPCKRSMIACQTSPIKHDMYFDQACQTDAAVETAATHQEDKEDRVVVSSQEHGHKTQLHTAAMAVLAGEVPTKTPTKITTGKRGRQGAPRRAAKRGRTARGRGGGVWVTCVRTSNAVSIAVCHRTRCACG